jgi:hypothetical protein
VNDFAKTVTVERVVARLRLLARGIGPTDLGWADKSHMDKHFDGAKYFAESVLRIAGVEEKAAEALVEKACEPWPKAESETTHG